MSIEQALLREFGPVVSLDEISKQYFGLSPTEARRRAALNRLPIAAFRLYDSRKAPLMVRVADLAAYIDAVAECATEEHANSQL